MNQTRQTLTFVIAAAVLAGVAVATHFVTRPTPLEGFEKIGSEFYADFDPSQATSLRVVSYNADEASISEFEVERKDGLWRIPSHHNYPADAQDQLAKAAASLLGLQREALASRQKSDHEKFGVISPEADDPAQITGLGQRITVTDQSGKVLADLIIGKEVDDREGFYYVRRPDEKETYFARLELDISTKFAKWIEQDLLKMDRWNVVKLVMSKPGINEEGRIVDRERVELFRKDTAAQWQMTGLDEAAEEVDRSKVDELLRNIDEMEIVGVRPKPRQITPDLRVEIPAEFRSSQTAVRRFAQLQLGNLAQHGFEIGFGTGDDLRVYSPEGAELALATNEGVVYHVHLGDVFTGTLQEIEIGGQSAEAKEDEQPAANGEQPAAAEPDDAPAEDAQPASEGDAESSPDTSGRKLNRYVFVRAQFDPSHVGPEPVKPEEPQKPEGLTDAATPAAPDASAPDAASPPADAPADAPQPPDAAPAADPADGPPGNEDEADEESEADEAEDALEGEDPADADEPDTAPAAPADQPADDAQPDAEPAEAGARPAEAATPADPAGDQAKLRAEYNAALKQYQASLSDYERKREDYNRKVKAGQEKVDELNRRFRDWYYVISGASLENLKISRVDLVKPKTATEKTDDAPPGPALSPANGQSPADAAPATPPAEADTPGEAATPEADAGQDPPAAAPAGGTGSEAPAAAGDTPAGKPQSGEPQSGEPRRGDGDARAVPEAAAPVEDPSPESDGPPGR